MSAAMTLLYDGKQKTVRQIATILGVSYEALYARITKYGPDCCWTYFPGQLPKNITSMRPIFSNTENSNRAYGDWGKMGNKPRTKRLLKIKIGTWEMRQLAGAVV